MKMIDFIDLTLEEAKKVLDWRNHENVRKWMYTNHIISLAEHLCFIESLKNQTNQKYFVVKNDFDYYGVVCFTQITDDSACFGIYANPECTIKGIGRILEEVAINYVFNILKLDILKLEVFSTNLKAINFYKKYNFKETKRVLKNNQEVICMELKKIS